MNPELKAMSDVFDALKGLDAATRKRVTDWVLARLQNATDAPASSKGAKRGRKPGIKKAGAKRGPKAKVTTDDVVVLAKKRGPKAGAKRGRKPAAAAASTPVAKKAGKRGRPAGKVKKAVKKTAGRRGRPAKVAVA